MHRSRAAHGAFYATISAPRSRPVYTATLARKGFISAQPQPLPQSSINAAQTRNKLDKIRAYALALPCNACVGGFITVGVADCPCGRRVVLV